MAEMVQKSSGAEIVNHWILAVSCILLIISGFGFVFKSSAIGSLFGGFESMKTIHNWAGVIFTASLLLSMGSYLKESLTFDADDRQWLKVNGGYLSKNVTVPPIGKHNPGQKIYYLLILVAGIAVALSGFGIWLMKDNSQVMLLSHLVHNITFCIFAIAVPGHIYLSTLANPGTFQIMVNGKVPLGLAKRRYPKWMKAAGKM